MKLIADNRLQVGACNFLKCRYVGAIELIMNSILYHDKRNFAEKTDKISSHFWPNLRQKVDKLVIRWTADDYSNILAVDQL